MALIKCFKRKEHDSCLQINKIHAGYHKASILRSGQNGSSLTWLEAHNMQICNADEDDWCFMATFVHMVEDIQDTQDNNT